MSSAQSSSSRSPTGPEGVVLSYRMHVSQKYLELTKKKLELTRLPREPQTRQPGRWNLGLSKTELEPLVDHWMEEYSWREQEAYFNDTLPQFRMVVQGTRLHYVHKQSTSPNALPLIFVHGYPESFIGVTNMIDLLTNPISTPPAGNENEQAFHVVAPSIPGFGFSDQVAEEGNNLASTAELFDALMKSLGFPKYIATGSGWGFKICRLMALTHSESCVGIHTTNPDVPDPRMSYGWQQNMSVPASPAQGNSPTHASNSPPLTPGSQPLPVERPQTASYALCDSPTGLLAHIVDAIRPDLYSSQSPGSGKSAAQEVQSPWNPTALVNWCMLYWLPGPEVALRWIINSTPMIPRLWSTHSHVPLAISQFSVQNSPLPGTQWSEAYHRIAAIHWRPGNVRFPAWERASDVVMDIRDLASRVKPVFFGAFAQSPGSVGVMLPPAMVPSNMRPTRGQQMSIQ